ncbi:hypothetical protein [Frigoriglobus tundricola]|uniref:Uncharacterized protein n=1 Tax=Frigoriglobus tundricola TaxID=2774151 RepID=A0A6M5YGG8_9BACT|nr:hypothetical protein [Frigoriglobus tundricola]QJW93105.1 hypothetical protein FTUN_0608 [Frigoriglobus tundricola]
MADARLVISIRDDGPTAERPPGAPGNPADRATDAAWVTASIAAARAEEDYYRRAAAGVLPAGRGVAGGAHLRPAHHLRPQ